MISKQQVQTLAEAVQLSERLPKAEQRASIEATFINGSWQELIDAAYRAYASRSDILASLKKGVSLRLEMIGEKVFLEYDSRKAQLILTVPFEGGREREFILTMEIPCSGSEKDFQTALEAEIDKLKPLCDSSSDGSAAV